MAAKITLDGADATRFGLKDGTTLTMAEYTEHETRVSAIENGRKRAETFVANLNKRLASVERQERLFQERLDAANDAAKRRDRFAAELAELESKKADRLADGYEVRENRDPETVTDEDGNVVPGPVGSYSLMLNGEEVTVTETADEDNGNGSA